jgi:hypothetical protein
MGIEDATEAGPVGAPGQAVEPAVEAADPSRLDHRQQEQDDRGGSEPDDGRSDERRDEGIEIDRWVLRASAPGDRATGGPSLAGGPARSITR